MVTVADILQYIESAAPSSLAEGWDNVGLLCGSRSQEVTKVLVALDPFEGVCREAAELGADLIVTHHPLIFDSLRSVTDETGVGRSIRLLCRQGISAINAHTNYDLASGGVNDVLADTLGLENVQIIRPLGTDDLGRPYGLLRQGDVEEQPLEDFLAVVKEKLSCPGLRYVDGGKTVRRVAVGGGSCGSELMEAFCSGCDTFVTSDVKYNQFWDARDLGLNLIDAGHFYTENPAMPVLAEKLQAAFPEIRVIFSKTHRDCMKFY